MRIDDTRTLGKLPASASRVLLAAMLGLSLGCPGDDTGGDTEVATTADPDTGTTNGNPPPGTTTDDPSDTTTGPPPATDSSSTVGPATDSGTTDGTADSGSGSGSDSGSDSGSTGDPGPCQIMLPPPAMCMNPGAGFPGGINLECDPIAQDCPMGEKCMPWANDGGSSWNATTCNPVDPMPAAIGDPCTVVGSGVSGIDNCELGSMCWDVDVMTNMGTCIELCGCSYADPICQTPNTVCSISNNDSLPICIPVCNPLDPMACGPGTGCYPVGAFFQCAPDASGGGGMAGDPCQFINVCEPGNVCVGAAAIPGCPGGVGCCTPTCDAAAMDPCPLAGTTCTAWYEAGAAPDGCLQTVGACVAP